MTSDLQQLVNAFDAGALVRSVSGSVSLVDVARAVGHLNYRGAPATSKRCDSGFESRTPPEHTANTTVVSSYIYNLPNSPSTGKQGGSMTLATTGP